MMKLTKDEILTKEGIKKYNKLKVHCLMFLSIKYNKPLCGSKYDKFFLISKDNKKVNCLKCKKILSKRMARYVKQNYNK